ncbi:energy-coupling factor transporter transmembrane component T [Alcanivorax sp. 1008]|uniref:energy-coupling factor transporter transmembrane component T n=1 Tax=Alcanivorax sp. 1008 TaxID=2816853 RepID=UPI001DA15BE3|nr:energy-coupling factor transporter transmembrane component T [Alcanivorax sp. 1008]MCC1495343.1 hypothetical protein [Alcanivorax sp. 1008]
MTAGNNRSTLAKVYYLLGLAISLFLIAEPLLLAGLFLLQLSMWFRFKLPVSGVVHIARKLRLFFLIIFITYMLTGTGEDTDHWLEVPVSWLPDLSLSGATLALLMCLRVMTLVLASTWLQQTSPPRALVVGLRHLRIPESVALTVDATLALLGGQDRGGQGHGKGGGKGRGKGDGEGRGDGGISWADIRAGRLAAVDELLQGKFRQSRRWLAERYPELPRERLHDLTVVLGVSLTVMGLKVLQILPGVPIASGHKNMLIVPLLLFAANATYMRFGALAAGTTTGIVSFLMGYGKFGILEIAHFAVPGLLADMLMPIARATSRGGKLLQFALIGAAIGAGRFAANLLVIVLAGAPQLAFVLFLPMLASQLLFGTLSCFVSVLLVNRNFTDSPEDHSDTQLLAADNSHKRKKS